MSRGFRDMGNSAGWPTFSPEAAPPLGVFEGWGEPAVASTLNNRDILGESPAHARV